MAQYGQIIQNQVAGTINHTMGTVDFCAFLTQFANGGVGANGTPRMYIAGQSSTQVVVANPGAAMGADVILVSPMSVLDVGPLVAGTPTRLASQTTPYLTSKGLWSYRSLHQYVPVQLVQGAGFASIDITHLLNTIFSVAFVTPRFDPWDGDAGIMWFTSTVPSVNTIRLRFERQDGVAFKTATRWVSFDVMVLAYADPAGLLPESPFSVMRYTGVTPSPLPNYQRCYPQEFIIQAGSNFTHNMNGVPLSVLMQMHDNPLATTANYIHTRDPGGTGTQIILAATANPATKTDILFMRSHSRLWGNGTT